MSASPHVAAELAKNDIGTSMPVAIMAEVRLSAFRVGIQVAR